MAVREHFCHNCHYHRELPDSVHCGWCLDFFYENRRMPRPGDRKPTTLERLYAQLDQME